MAEILNCHNDDNECQSVTIQGRLMCSQTSNINSPNNIDSNLSTAKSNGCHGAINDKKICRDFTRKVCHRGNRCKFQHPKESEPNVVEAPNKRELTFCHDFQNGLCQHSPCRFIHCTVGEEEYYLKTGNILPHILDQATNKGQIVSTGTNGEAPVCKDYLFGACLRKRGGKCRFRHLTKSEYEKEVYRGDEVEAPKSVCTKGGTRHLHPCNGDTDNTASFGQIASENKRQRLDRELDLCHRERMCQTLNEMGREDFLIREMSLRNLSDRQLDMDIDRRGLDEVLYMRINAETLKKEVAILKKENSDLRATNDFLLEKLTTLGFSKAGGTVTTVSVPTVPTVSLASTTIPVATSVRPLMAAQVSHPLSITTECSVGSIVAITPPHAPPRGQQQPQQPPQSLTTQSQVGVASSGATVLGSVAVSLSQTPLTAVSIGTVTLNPSIATATSMAPSIGTVPPGTGATIAQAMSISGATTGHLVTYPIVAQTGLRTTI